MQLVPYLTTFRSMIPVIATIPIYSILSDQSKTSTYAVTRVAIAIFASISLYTNPVIFLIGSHIGLIGGKLITTHITQKINGIWKNSYIPEKFVMFIVSGIYLQFPYLFPSIAFYSSSYLFSRYDRHETLTPPPVLPIEEKEVLWQKVTIVSVQLFITGLNLYQNPNIFFLGSNIGLIGAVFINHCVVKTVMGIWHKMRLAEKSLLFLTVAYMDYSIIGPLVALYSSIYLAGKYTLARMEKTEQLCERVQATS